MIRELLKQRMQQYGYHASIVKLGRINELRTEFEELHSKGNVDESLYQWLNGFYKFTPPDTDYDITSIIIIASSSPQARVFFTWKGNSIPIVMPPTYLDFISKPKVIEKHLQESFCTMHAHFLMAGNLPYKILAARSGLGAYGRNNLVYVPDFGSFVLLSAFYSDLPVDEDDWGEIQLMEYCRKCSVCMRNCPTGAITKNRFTIEAEKCVTYYNELWGKDEFPDWIKPSAHNCIVGCMRCQNVCPRNREYIHHFMDIESFSEEETTFILEKKEMSNLPEPFIRKLEKANLKMHYNYLSRNLKVLLI